MEPETDQRLARVLEGGVEPVRRYMRSPHVEFGRPHAVGYAEGLCLGENLF